MEKIIISAFLVAKPDKEQAVREVLEEVLTHSRQEEGCIQYDVHQSLENTHQFLIYEIWVNEDEIHKHIDTEHYQNYRKNIEPLIESRNVQKWSLI